MQERLTLNQAYLLNQVLQSQFREQAFKEGWTAAFTTLIIEDATFEIMGYAIFEGPGDISHDKTYELHQGLLEVPE